MNDARRVVETAGCKAVNLSRCGGGQQRRQVAWRVRCGEREARLILRFRGLL
jgi:hypothetical protein